MNYSYYLQFFKAKFLTGCVYILTLQGIVILFFITIIINCPIDPLASFIIIYKMSKLQIHSNILITMQVIISQAVQNFAIKLKDTPTDDKILRYIKSHRFYTQQLSSSLSQQQQQSIVKQIRQKISQSKDPSVSILQRVEQLSLYLKKQTNRLMFQIYEIILKNPNGLTYRQIQRKTKNKLQIVNISHYCCRLRKMNFVQLKNQKSQKIVYPKTPVSQPYLEDVQKSNYNPKKYDEQQDDDDQQQNYNNNNKNQGIKTPFLFNQLSIVDNIWVNVSSLDSYYNKGITNQQIKYKICKQSDSKLVMKLMENIKQIYKFKRQMVSQGKVFQHRYHNVTNQITNYVENHPLIVKNKNNKKQKMEQEQEQQISQNIQSEQLKENIGKFLLDKFPQFQGNDFMRDLINKQMKSYHSAAGVKSAKRSCTPIKLIRYIKILNSLDQRYPQSHSELKRYIIDEQKTIQNGTMHKRSIVGILEGLVNTGILRQQDQFYYPQWEPEGQQIDPKMQKMQKRSLNNNNMSILSSMPRKRVQLNSIGKQSRKDNKFDIGAETTMKGYQLQLRTKLLVADIQIMIKNRLKKALKSLLFAKRIKTAIKYYQPEINIINLLPTNTTDHSMFQLPQTNKNSYEDFINQIDFCVQKYGKRQQDNLQKVNYDIIKIFRKFPRRNEESLKLKFGNNWKEKLTPMLETGYLISDEEGGVKINSENNRLFI